MVSVTEANHPIKVGIIGSGYGVSTLLPAIASRNEFQVLAIADSGRSDFGTTEVKCRGVSVPHTSAEHIINASSIELVVIASPPQTQEQYAIMALENGKSIYCEKPGGLNVDATKHITKVIGTTGGHATVGYQFRYDPAIRWLTKKCASGGLGHIRRVAVQWETAGALKTPAYSWRNDRVRGGGVLRDFASHIFDYLSVIDPSNFCCAVDEDCSGLHKFESKASKSDIQEIYFSGEFGSARFDCRVSRNVPNPLGHRIEIEGDAGRIQVTHRTPFGLKDLRFECWSMEEGKMLRCSDELGLVELEKGLRTYELDMRQFAVRNLFGDLAGYLRGHEKPLLPNFGQALLNQVHVAQVEDVLYRG